MGRVRIREGVVKMAAITKKKNAAAVSLGRKGGKARLTTMTPEQRTELAKKAANARWAKR